MFDLLSTTHVTTYKKFPIYFELMPKINIDVEEKK